jgi:hypothetical protein
METINAISLRAAAAITATDTGAAVKLPFMTGNGYVLLNSSAATGADNVSAVKLQHSDDGATNWTDTGVAFANVTNSGASFQALYVSLDQFKRYVRAVNTLTGTTPGVTYSVSMLGKPH